MNILCATDLLLKSDPAIERAHRLRAALGARLTLLHVVTPGEASEGTLEQRLLSANSRLAHRVRRSTAPVELIVRCGRPAKVIADVARARRSGLIVIGPHQPDPLTDAVKGTLTERIVGDTNCPVLVVRREPRDAYHGVMLALDGSSTMRDVVDAAEALVITPDSECVAIHAHEPPYEAMMTSVGVAGANVTQYASASIAQAAEAIRRELRAHNRHPERYRLLIVEARPAPAIRRALKEVSPDLLVLGTRGHGRFRRALLGSTANEVLGSADCDVLLVPDNAVRAAKQGVGPRTAAKHPDDFGPGAA